MHLDHNIRIKKTTSQELEVPNFSWLDFFKSSWWILLFCGGCLGIYAHCMEKKQSEYLDIKEKIKQLELQRDTLAKVQDNLKLQIHSQNDPEWIELTLKKQLGLVPDGQMKVYFKRDE